MEKLNGIELIAQERREQIEKHGRTIDNDVDQNDAYQLVSAASMLTWVNEEDYDNDPDMVCPSDWDVKVWRKMMHKPYKERLIIAGALIAAEIDRLQRLEG